MYAQIDVVGTAVDLHSGGYGGVVQNPANALARIIAALKGPDGRIRIPGFYDDVVPLSDADRAAIAALPFDEAAYRERLGLPALVGEAGYHDARAARRRGRPSTSTASGAASRARAARRSSRPTPMPRSAAGSSPPRIRTGSSRRSRPIVEEIAPPGVTTTVRLLGGGLPSLTPIDHPATQAAARALEATFGQAPVYIREGGSIPVCASFESILGLPVVLLGFVQPDAHAHAPERVDGPRQLRDEHPDDRPGLGRAGRPAALSGAGSVRKWYVRLGDAGTCRC